jgi:phosphatidylglycerol lysyltransferase
VGEQPVWEPGAWEGTLKASRSLREQLRRARAKGVRVRRVAPGELADAASATRRAIEALLARWLATRPMAPMGFLVQLHLFAFPEERRCFVAEREGRLVAFLNAVPVYGRGGWFLEDLLRAPDAPNGSAELLVDAAMREAAAEGAPYLTLGLVPLAGALGAPLRLARWLGAALYDFEGLRAFKAKLRPQRWDPIYLCYPARPGAAVALYDALAAFSRGGLLRFGVETLLRGPMLLLRAMALLLVPWTLVLALAPGEQWFPSPWVQAGWVLFDAGVAPALYALTVRWRPRLALGLALAVTGDALLTLTQALLFNLPRVRGVLDAAVVAASLAAPSFAAFLLWRARAHRSRLHP